MHACDLQPQSDIVAYVSARTKISVGVHQLEFLRLCFTHGLAFSVRAWIPATSNSSAKDFQDISGYCAASAVVDKRDHRDILCVDVTANVTVLLRV